MRSLIYIFICTTILFYGCEKSLIHDDNKPLTQFGDGIIEYSSEYNMAPGPWSSFVVLGSPDTYPSYGDIQTAWAPKSRDAGYEYLTLGFDTAQYVDQIAIYETYNPGAVTSVSLRNAENGAWRAVFADTPEKNLKKESRIMKIDIPMTSFPVDAIRIDLACHSVLGWNEIDAVSIQGYFE